MPIIQTASIFTFIEAFRAHGRMGQFTSSGLRALFDHLNDLSVELGEPIELDVTALCRDYSAYDSALEAATEHGYEPDSDDDEDDQEAAALDWLHDQTTVLEHKAGVIVASFQTTPAQGQAPCKANQ